MKCSVIVANYNNGKYLPDLIKSVQNQTYTNWELIITDDCSEDDSLKIIQLYLQNDKIKLLRHNKNYGAAQAFKTCINNSNGEIIAMLGADDALKENAIEEIVLAHKKNPNASMIIANLICCDTELNSINKQIKFISSTKEQCLLTQFGISGWDTFKRTFYNKTEGFDATFKRAVDQDLYFKMEEVGELKSLDKNLYLYRTNPEGISQQSNKSYAHEYNYLAVIKAYHRRKENGFQNISKKYYREVLMNYHYLKFFNACKRGEIKEEFEKGKDLINNCLKGIKPQNIEQLKSMIKLVEQGNDYEKGLAKQKLIQSYFIKEIYNFTVLKELFNKELTPYNVLSLNRNIKIIIKSILGWKKKSI